MVGIVARAARGAKLEAATKGTQRVRALETRLRHLDEEAVEAPRKEWQLRIELPAATRSGDVVASLRGAVVQRGAFRLGPVTSTSGGLTASRSPVPTAAARRPCCMRCSAGCPSPGGPPCWGTGWSSASSTRPAAR